MTSRRLRRLASLLFVVSFACDSPYSLTFVCEPDAGKACPPGTECPELPLGSGCGDLPAVLGHAPIPATVGRPAGCRAGLPYGNAAYGDSQVICTCQSTSTWYCPI